ncbi:hypothetical protein PNEG_02332 [Pneumocystis murina B123]|uniref:Uncharacterized protein n=1 Tax=Pneumocystis murina (strain B123) TaxID=1069680 RepID=M7P6A0_PNEMU|nr:hypothetical protein PNEG_02332 [Pneumocystis murina B123]EMR09385.1 hypothetical protein PNEG_02332 [Pneumocystis murina B123]
MIYDNDENDTEIKLALLSSIFPDKSIETLLEKLVENNGIVENILNVNSQSDFKNENALLKRKKQRKIEEFIENDEYKHKRTFVSGKLSSDTLWPIKMQNDSFERSKRVNVHVQHLYFPDQIAKLTPCTLIHNFLGKDLCNSLLLKMLKESETWERNEFRLFERKVVSPHKSCYYLYSDENKLLEQKFFHNGLEIKNVREFSEEMNVVRLLVKDIVNKILSKRENLEYQYPGEWDPNIVVANLYSNAKENLGYHSDQLTYLGPMPTIACISLGTEREFRLKRVGFEHNESVKSIHLPHNSLLIMHSPCQEDYKHSIHPAHTVMLHPISGTIRISITYRFCRKTYQPKYIPTCKCNIPSVLRCVQKKRSTKGRYFWSCNANKLVNGNGKGCQFFQWAVFTKDGENILAYKE